MSTLREIGGTLSQVSDWAMKYEFSVVKVVSMICEVRVIHGEVSDWAVKYEFSVVKVVSKLCEVRGYLVK